MSDKSGVTVVYQYKYIIYINIICAMYHITDESLDKNEQLKQEKETDETK